MTALFLSLKTSGVLPAGTIKPGDTNLIHGQLAQFNEEKLMDIAGQSAAVASLHAWKQVRQLVNGRIFPMLSGSKVILSFSKAHNVTKVPRITVRSVARWDGHLVCLACTVTFELTTC